jgi:ParB family transcriptional regulator, chromosome partitioning protein
MTEPLKTPSRLDMVRGGQTFDMPRTGRLVVSVEKVVEDPRNERKVFRSMDGLVASMKAVGLVEPITATTTSDGRYQIITGHRRYRAAVAAGLSQIEILIREPEAERARRRKSLVSNIQREAIGPVELAEALQEQLEEDGDVGSQASLAEVIGKDKTWVSAMLRILTLPIRLRERVGTSQLSISWESVARIARLSDVALQEELVDALLDGATHQEIRQRIQEKTDAREVAENEQSKKVRPRNVYRTTQETRVIVQSEIAMPLSAERIVASLKEALGVAELESQ